MRYVMLIPLAWVAGIGAYFLALLVFYGETTGQGDLFAVLYWSFLAFAVCVPAVYLPCLFGLRWLLGGWRPFIAFPLAASALGVIPAALIVLLWGGLRDLLSSEAVVFYCLFTAVGVVLGSGVAWHRPKAA